MLPERSPDQPPYPPKKLSYRHTASEGEIVLRKRAPLAMKIVVGGFLTVWLSGWTFCCGMLALKAMEEPSFATICFAIPFWIGWFAAAGALMAILFGRQTFRLDETGLFDEYRVLLYVTQRRVPLAEIRGFRVTKKKGEKSDTYAAEAQTDGKPVEIAAESQSEAEWLAFEMNRLLVGLTGECVPDADVGVVEIEETLPDEDEEEPQTCPSAVIPMTTLPRHAAPPSDCRWKIHTGLDSVTFQHRGELTLAGFVEITFFMLFWNAMVTLFIMKLWWGEKGPEFLSGQWWLQCLFLIPFAVIGLVLLVAWIFCVTQPFQCTRWRFSRHSATRRITCFGIGLTRRYPLEDCREMVIDAPRPGRRIIRRVTPDEGLCKLAFIDFDDRKLFEIDDLTPGEARWMADNVLGW